MKKKIIGKFLIILEEGRLGGPQLYLANIARLIEQKIQIELIIPKNSEKETIEKFNEISQTGSVEDNCLIEIATYDIQKRK